MFANVLLLTTIFLGAVLLRLLRRFDGSHQGYVFLVAAEFTLALIGLLQGENFLGQLAIYLSILTIAIPWLLEGVSSHLFNRGRMSLAVRMMNLRSILMPGSGLAKQQQVLHGILILEQKGVDAALQYFRALISRLTDGQDSADDEIVALVHEQIVSMLFYDHRWDEGISYYEGRFQRGYAAMRPVLALGLLRAYGEIGKLDHAAKLLRALEESPLAVDPRAIDLMGQARLTFLAYAGSAQWIDQVIDDEQKYKVLGLSRASGAFFHGIALARSGQLHKAKTELQRVDALAGPREERVIAASKSVLAHLTEERKLELEPELHSYTKAVGERLSQLLQRRQSAVPIGTPWATFCLVAACIAGYFLTLAVHSQGTIGLLKVGAFSIELWQSGSWWRVFTASFVHTEMITTAIHAYSIWLAGQIVERSLGTGRTLLIAIGGGVVAMLTIPFLAPDTIALVGGSHGVATALITSALWTLIPGRNSNITAKMRKGIALTLAFLLGAQILACIPDEFGMSPKPISLVGAAVVATVLAWFIPLRLPKLMNKIMQIAAIAAVALLGFSLYKTAREDLQTFLRTQPMKTVVQQGVEFNVPEYFDPLASTEVKYLSMDIFAESLLDRRALQMGDVLAIMVVLHKQSDEEKQNLGGSRLLTRFPHLRNEFRIYKSDDVPEEFSQSLERTKDPWQTYTLRRNGIELIRIIERDLGDRSVVLASSPPSIIEQSPALYAAIIGGAKLTE